MFLSNFLDRKKTDPMFPLFEIIYVIELVVLTLAITLGIVLIPLCCRMRYHLNVRMRVVFSMFHGIIYPMSRVVIIYHEYYGPITQDHWIYLALCTQIKEEFLGYFTTLIIILSIDRLVATKYWAWYEQGGCGTLLFFIAQEMCLIIIGNILGFCVLFEIITDIQSIYYFAIVVPIGTGIFIMVYRYNRREMVKMKRGAEIHRYSVAKSFQFKENIKLLETFSNIARPLIFVCAPPFIFYPIYAFVPANIGYDELRYFSVAMYDLWLSIACVVVIGSLPIYEPMLRIRLCCFSRRKEQDVVVHENVDHADAYFALLNNDLAGMKNISKKLSNP